MLENTSMSSPEDFRVKTSAEPIELPLDYSGCDHRSGSSSSVSLMSSDLTSSSPKTVQSFVLADWTRCSGHSMRSGMMRSGIVSRLPSLGPATNGTERGLLPTPTCSDAKGAPKNRYFGSATYRHNLCEALR